MSYTISDIMKYSKKTEKYMGYSACTFRGSPPEFDLFHLQLLPKAKTYILINNYLCNSYSKSTGGLFFYAGKTYNWPFREGQDIFDP
jgi:hypothetical protein